MTLYVDSSALVKLHVDEPDAEAAHAMLEGATWTTARHTWVEVRRALSVAFRDEELVRARSVFAEQWQTIQVVELDQRTCEAAAAIAEAHGVKTLDALHLGAAAHAGPPSAFVTFDERQAGAARALGWNVLGAA